jgi:hypothetical protein
LQKTEFNADLAEAESSQPDERQDIPAISTLQYNEVPLDLIPNSKSREEESEDVVAPSSMQEACDEKNGVRNTAVRLPIL